MKCALSLFVFGLLFLTSCGVAPKGATGAKDPITTGAIAQLPAKEQNGIVYPGAQPLTAVGSNSQGSFSKDGRKVIFVSEARPAHKTQQIYELDLQTGRERRLTYQDGYLSAPAYTQKPDEIVYSSSTDEMKERLDLGRLLSGERGASVETTNARKSELYLRQTGSAHVERITRNPGFDGYPFPHPQKRSFVFVSERDGSSRLMHYALDRSRTEVLAQAAVIESPSYSPQANQLAWSQGTESEKQIVIASSTGKNLKTLTTKKSFHLHPRWNPDGTWLVLSSNRDDSTRFSIYALNTLSGCIARLSDHTGNDLEPSFSPDGKKLLFTHKENGSSQLYVMDFKVPEVCGAE